MRSIPCMPYMYIHMARSVAACILPATICRAPRDEQDAKGSCCTDTALLDAAQAALPFQLTHAQQRSLDQILADMAKPFPMNRLLQVQIVSCCGAVWDNYMLTPGQMEPLHQHACSVLVGCMMSISSRVAAGPV